MTTEWTAIIAVIQEEAGSGGNSEAALRALDGFCERYYLVIKQFFLHRGCSEHAAQDLTQEFFARKVCSTFGAREGFLFKVKRRADSRFRGYLFTVLWRFYIDRQRCNHDGDHDPLDELQMPGPTSPVGLEFDRIFAMELIRRVIGDNAHSQAFLAYLQNKESSRNEAQARTAEKLGMSVEAFKTGLHRFHRKLGRQLWDEVSRYAGPEEQEIKAEILHLLRQVTEPVV